MNSEFCHLSNSRPERLAEDVEALTKQAWQVVSITPIVLSGNVMHHAWLSRSLDTFEILDRITKVSTGLTENRLREVCAAAIGEVTGSVLTRETEMHVQTRVVAGIYGAGWKHATTQVLIQDHQGLRYIEVDATATDDAGNMVVVQGVRA